MLNGRQDVACRAAGEKPSVGSLFVPARVQRPPGSSTSRPQHQRDAQVAHIAGLQRQPVSVDGLGAIGLLLPGQQLLRPQQQQEQQQQQQAARPQPVAAAPSATKPKLRLSWAGSGIYFWWQLGAVQYLTQQFHLAKVPMVGASGGGLAAVLAACEVEPEAVMESALRLSREHNVWERPLGLMGTWGGIIEQWLHDLLPPDAAERCAGQVDIVVTQLPFCNQVAIGDFRDKRDLIDVAMASAHVPLFLDWRVTRPCRGVSCVDGSFPDFFTNDNCDLLKCGGDAVVFDYFDDANIVRNGRMDMLELKEYSEFKRITLLGYKYAKRLHEEGIFARYDTTGVAR